MNDPASISPERRIAGRLTHWELDIEHLAHYAKQTGRKRLQRRLARLKKEIQLSLTEARAAIEGK